MTNETTASQPKSIGDDAQFRARLADLYSAYDESIELGISEPNDRAVSKLIAVIDNFCAPAAQASATIQEPVMVAEPAAYADPKAFENFKAGTATNEWMWAKPDAGLVPIFLAAPMVADPAGVAGTDIEAAERVAVFYDDDDREGIKSDVLNSFYAGIRHARRAATVKAVPSEAQEVLQWVEKLADKPPVIMLCECEAYQGGICAECKAIAILAKARAAPLADKTDESE